MIFLGTKNRREFKQKGKGRHQFQKIPSFEYEYPAKLEPVKTHSKIFVYHQKKNTVPEQTAQ